MKQRWYLLLPALVGLTLWPALSQAAIIITDGNVPGNPDENLLFQGAGHVSGPATTVTGRTNTNAYLLDATSTSTLVGQGGQSTINAQTGLFGDVILNNFRNQMNQQILISDLEFLVTVDMDSELHIQVLDSMAGVHNMTFNVSKNGQNKIRIYGDGMAGANYFIQVSMSTTLPMNILSAQFEDLHQIRITGFDPNGPGPVVPEPASMAIWGVAAAIGCLRLRRRKR